MPKTQKQRSAARKLRDKDDARYVADRAEDRCEVCHKPCPYVPGWSWSGSNHHSQGKQTEALRRDRSKMIWLCMECHTKAHASDGTELRAEIDDIIARRN